MEDQMGLKGKTRVEIKYFLLSLISRLVPTRALRICEEIGQFGQGKGWDGGLEKEIRTLISLANSLGLTKLKALDVGANQGLWTAQLKTLTPHSEIHAFEPSNTAFQLLKKNTQCLDGVVLHQIAVGNTIGKVELFSDRDASPLASLNHRRLSHEGIDFSQVESIEVTTLEEWQKDYPSFTPNILKIDVEGYEFEVLKGCAAVLNKIRIIQFEFGGTDIDSRVFFQDYWYFFIGKNFNIFRLSPKGLIQITKYSESEEIFKFSTFYAVSQTPIE
jgi:FkbM family methyltransferase